MILSHVAFTCAAPLWWGLVWPQKMRFLQCSAILEVHGVEVLAMLRQGLDSAFAMLTLIFCDAAFGFIHDAFAINALK